MWKGERMIITNDCVGCGKCLDYCQHNAIVSSGKYSMQIDENLCIECKECQEACDEYAIVTSQELFEKKELRRLLNEDRG